MNKPTNDFEGFVRMMVSEEISKQLGTYIAAQAIGEGITAKEKESEYLSVNELSSLTGLKKTTIYAKRSKRELPAYKFGRELRFRRSEIEDWMRTKRQTCLTSEGGSV